MNETNLNKLILNDICSLTADWSVNICRQHAASSHPVQKNSTLFASSVATVLL